MAELADLVWVIVHPQTTQLWGKDGWVTPPGEVLFYDNWAEVNQECERAGGTIIEFVKGKKVL